MLKTAQHAQIGNFYRALKALRDPFTGAADAGLIVASDKYNLDEFYPPGNAVLISVDEKNVSEAVREAVVSALESGSWVVLELKTTLIPLWLYGALRDISSLGQAELHNFRGQSKYTIRPKGDARVLVVTTSQILEKLPVNTFLSLFGPIVRL